MNYEKAIAKFREIYRPTTREEVLREFEQDDGTLGIYVHNPFCTTLCKFCYYKGVKFDRRRDSELYERYYGDYLPGVIAPFLPVIGVRNVISYFFGGGTPSLMSADTMRGVFRLFPDLAHAPSKTIEIHPAIWDERQLDVLAEFGFSCADYRRPVLRRNRIGTAEPPPCLAGNCAFARGQAQGAGHRGSRGPHLCHGRPRGRGDLRPGPA